MGPTDVAAHAGTSPLAGTALRGPPLVEKFLGTPTWALYLSGPTLGSIISGDPRMSRGDPQMVFHPHVPRNGSGEPARAWSPAWDMVARGSLQWLPARVMSDLPRWHTQRCGRCQNSRYLYGQRRGLPPRRQLPVRPEHDRVQSCAIALRSPASERTSDLNPGPSPGNGGQIETSLSRFPRNLAR